MTWTPPPAMEPQDVAAHDALIGAYRAIIAELRSRWERAERPHDVEAARWRTQIAAGDAQAMLTKLVGTTARESRDAA